MLYFDCGVSYMNNQDMREIARVKAEYDVTDIREALPDFNSAPLHQLFASVKLSMQSDVFPEMKNKIFDEAIGIIDENIMPGMNELLSKFDDLEKIAVHNSKIISEFTDDFAAFFGADRKKYSDLLAKFVAGKNVLPKNRDDFRSSLINMPFEALADFKRVKRAYLPLLEESLYLRNFQEIYVNKQQNRGTNELGLRF